MKTGDILRKLEIKITKPREMIYEIISESEEGLDAETIKGISEEQGLFVNLSTVYRTLELYEKLGIIEKYDTGHNKYKYFLRKDSHGHSIECEVCGKNIEIDCPMTKIEEYIKDETGFEVLEHHLELKGVCKECRLGLKKDSMIDDVQE